jgi:predicted DNA binding protein
MTIHGTADGLKRIKNKLEVLIPKQMDMRISKILIGDWMTAPNLPARRTLVIKTAVELGYYSVPRTCNQNDIAEVLGIKQGTVAEHLQHAESSIINSWGQQTSLSEPLNRN